MGTGYTRQSSTEIIDGEVGDASDFNDEYNAIESAFSGSTGHAHDGTTGEGPVIAELADGVVVNGTTLVFEGTADGHEATLAVTDPTADVTVTLPDSTDTLVGKATTDTLTNKTLTSPVLNGTLTGTAFLDEDNMASNSAIAVASQQSVKAYVDAQVTAADLDLAGDTGTDAIDLDSETLTLAGGTGITSVASTGTSTVTFNIDSTVATLTGSQTLTNKTLTTPTIDLSGVTSSGDLPVAAGGTGVSTLTDGGILLGSGTGAVTAMAVLTDGQMIVGDGTTDPVAESGATLRTSIGVAIGSDVQAYDAQLADISALAVTNSNVIVGDGANWVAETGATLRTSIGVSIGSDVQAYDAQLDDLAALAVTDGNVIVGDGSNWVAESGATARTSLGAAASGANGDITSLTALSTQITVAQGGTNLTSFTAGDLLYATGATTLAKLAKGTSSQTLKMNSGATAPEWVTESANDGGVAMAIALG